MYPNARAQRQTGAQVRGLFLDRRILIRGGAYEGARASTTVSSSNPAPAQPAVNPNGVPLVAGMARYNFIGVDSAYTFPQIYIDGSSHVSAGVGGQWQSHSGSQKDATTFYDYSALSADVFVDAETLRRSRLMSLDADQRVVGTVVMARKGREARAVRVMAT